MGLTRRQRKLMRTKPGMEKARITKDPPKEKVNDLLADADKGVQQLIKPQLFGPSMLEGVGHALLLKQYVDDLFRWYMPLPASAEVEKVERQEDGSLKATVNISPVPVLDNIELQLTVSPEDFAKNKSVVIYPETPTEFDPPENYVKPDVKVYEAMQPANHELPVIQEEMGVAVLDNRDVVMADFYEVEQPKPAGPVVIHDTVPGWQYAVRYEGETDALAVGCRVRINGVPGTVKLREAYTLAVMHDDGQYLLYDVDVLRGWTLQLPDLSDKERQLEEALSKVQLGYFVPVDPERLNQLDRKYKDPIQEEIQDGNTGHIVQGGMGPDSY